MDFCSCRLLCERQQAFDLTVSQSVVATAAGSLLQLRPPGASRYLFTHTFYQYGGDEGESGWIPIKKADTDSL